MLACGAESLSADPIELLVRVDCRIKSGNDDTESRSRDAIRARVLPKPKHLVTTGLDPVVHADVRL
jgi:hypothetical protein